MVKEWLKRNYNVEKYGEPTWQRLVEVVVHPAGGANPGLVGVNALQDIKFQLQLVTSKRPLRSEVNNSQEA